MYDYTIPYDLDKVNMVVDTLSRKLMNSLRHIIVVRKPLIMKIINWSVIT